MGLRYWRIDKGDGARTEVDRKTVVQMTEGKGHYNRRTILEAERWCRRNESSTRIPTPWAIYEIVTQ